MLIYVIFPSLPHDAGQFDDSLIPLVILHNAMDMRISSSRRNCA